MKRTPLAWLSEMLLTVTALPMLAMMLHVTLDVILKNVLNMPLQGTLEITAYYYMLSIVVLPMAFVEMARQSIAVDLFYQMMPRRMQIGVTGFALLLSAAGYGGLAWITFPDAVAAFERREIVMGAVRVYIWPARFLLPISLTVTALVCLVHAANLALSARARDELVPAAPHDPDHGVD
ncbi:TRAP transporter small permease subunit [Mangrovicoccus ximenensis]|uniref:TRAP transporter small permease subunit n=1 Tax=Mangrovicoccus ximenensis TaxID=1911570 RepID=UPI00137526A5|nr:TRAP transporter small permease [Mangrovicoccus ximenensis]